MQGEIENLERLIISSKLNSGYKMQPQRKTTVQRLKKHTRLCQENFRFEKRKGGNEKETIKNQLPFFPPKQGQGSSNIVQKALPIVPFGAYIGTNTKMNIKTSIRNSLHKFHQILPSLEVILQICQMGQYKIKNPIARKSRIRVMSTLAGC